MSTSVVPRQHTELDSPAVTSYARTWTVAVLGATAAWAVSLFLIVRERFETFRYARFDLGNMVQAVWSTTQGRPLETTEATTGDQVVRLAYHVDPILAALAPLWIAAPSPLSLIAVQVVAVSLGALPVFFLGRRHIGSERDAALLSLAYLAYPWIAWAAADAFHAVSLSISLLLFCVWFLDSNRLVAFGVCAVLVMSTGELMGLVLASLGVWYAIARGRRIAGLVISLSGALWSVVAVYVVVPAFAGGGSSVYYGVFDHVGGSPRGLVRTTFTDPGAIVSTMTERDDLIYLFLLGAPLAGAFVLAPAVAALASVPLAINLLAEVARTTDPHEHYVAGVLPFLFAAIAIGFGRLSATGRTRAVVLVLVLSLASTIALGPWPRTLLQASTLGPLPTDAEHVRSLERAISLIPDGASVSATNRVGSHLSARREFYSVPVVGHADWVVVERADTWVPTSVNGSSSPDTVRELVASLERTAEWVRVLDESGVVVFRRAAS